MADETRVKTDQTIDSTEALTAALAAHSDDLNSTKSAIERLNETIGRLQADIADLHRKLPDH